MTDMPLRCVVDASVGIKLFVDEEFSEQAHALFSCLAADPPAELYVPDLFYIECTNILLKYTRRFRRELGDAQADLADLKRLALRAVPTIDLMEDALIVANDKNLTAYDACYAALARQLGIALVTADEQLAEATATAILIGDFTAPRDTAE